MIGIGVNHNITNKNLINVGSKFIISLIPLQTPPIFLLSVFLYHFKLFVDIFSMIIPLPLFRGLYLYLARNRQSF